MRTCKAYASAYDNVGSEAKLASKFPDKNFKDIVPVEVKKEPIDYLLLQAGSVDITNLKTKDYPEKHAEYFKQEVRYAAKNMFVTAESALASQPTIKKVVIMTLTPRYDSHQDDPKSIKAILAQMYNNTLGELWLDSPVKDKVVVGMHNLECNGGVREARYRDIFGKRYDGYHLFGPSGKKAFTVSVLNILKETEILDQANQQISSANKLYSKLWQSQYQQRKQNNRNQRTNRQNTQAHRGGDIRTKSNNRAEYTNDHSQRYSVPTSNMFEHLNY